METESLKIVCFSPTGTTKKVALSIAKGLAIQQADFYDITMPKARENIAKTTANELLIVAVPVYMGRVPALINDYLNNIKAHKTPVVCVVVYGNRMFGNALLELSDIMSRTGCITIAAGAFIGEHSFSGKDYPIAALRPDNDDLYCAEKFGKSIKEKLLTMKSVDEMPKVHITGNYPYGGVTELWSVDFIEISDKCTHKGICAEVCPTGAIDIHDSSIIEKEKCISCCACIKNCPENARSIKESKVKEAAIRLNSLFFEPKVPEVFW